MPPLHAPGYADEKRVACAALGSACLRHFNPFPARERMHTAIECKLEAVHRALTSWGGQFVTRPIGLSQLRASRSNEAVKLGYVELSGTLSIR